MNISLWQWMNVCPMTGYQQHGLSVGSTWRRLTFVQLTRVNSRNRFAVDDSTRNIVPIIMLLCYYYFFALVSKEPDLTREPYVVQQQVQAS